MRLLARHAAVLFFLAHALSFLLTACARENPNAPTPARDWRGVAELDSYAASGNAKLYWYVSTNPGCIDPVCPPPGPEISVVEVQQSSSGSFLSYKKVYSALGGGADSVAISGLTDGQLYWFRVVARDAGGTTLLSSPPIMTVPGPVTIPSVVVPLQMSGYFSWAPSGDSIAYVDASIYNQHSVRILDLQTLASRAVATYPAGEDRVIGTEWSRDGNAIAFCHTPSLTNYKLDYRIWTVPVGGGMLASLTAGPIDFDGTWGKQNRLYFCRGTRDAPNIPEIWSVDPALPGSERAITSDQSMYKYHPSARGSDDLLVFSGRSPTHNYDLFLMSPAIGIPSPLTTGSSWNDHHPEWMSDGRHVTFVSDRSGHLEVWSVDVNSRAVTQLTRGSRGSSRQFAQWSPDGSRLATLEGRFGWSGPTKLAVYASIAPVP